MVSLRSALECKAVMVVLERSNLMLVLELGKLELDLDGRKGEDGGELLLM